MLLESAWGQRAGQPGDLPSVQSRPGTRRQEIVEAWTLRRLSSWRRRLRGPRRRDEQLLGARPSGWPGRCCGWPVWSVGRRQRDLGVEMEVGVGLVMTSAGLRLLCSVHALRVRLARVRSEEIRI
jgi:hypothetical protein